MTNVTCSSFPIKGENCEIYNFCLAGLLLLFFILWRYALTYGEEESYKRFKELVRQKGAVTEAPVVPSWLLEDRSTHKISCVRGTRLECRLESRPSEWADVYRWSIHKALQRVYDIKLPMTFCLMSVPQKGFKCCLGSPNEFRPDSDSEDSEDIEPDGYLLYQVCGEEKIQVTYYVTSDKVHVAGYCFYADDPLEPACRFYLQHSENIVVPEVKREKEKNAVIIIEA